MIKSSKHTKESRRKMGKNRKGKHNSPATEFKKGQKSKNWNGFKKGHKPWNWKGGEYKDSNGYILIYKPEHPFCNSKKCVFKHRFVCEKYLGRYLTSKEVVHHINEIKNDNRIQNLMVFKNRIYHFWFHKKGFCNPKGIIFDGSLL